MPRRRVPRPEGPEPLDRARILASVQRGEYRLGFQWHVQEVPEHSARKHYKCPGCAGEIRPGVSHLVVWRADSLFGERAIDERRHWHTGCWRAA